MQSWMAAQSSHSHLQLAGVARRAVLYHGAAKAPVLAARVAVAKVGVFAAHVAVTPRAPLGEHALTALDLFTLITEVKVAAPVANVATARLAEISAAVARNVPARHARAQVLAHASLAALAAELDKRVDVTQDVARHNWRQVPSRKSSAFREIGE